MGDALISILAFFVAISVLVAVHEYGHYIVGRWTGMKVLRFSIGFGKPLVTWVRGEDRTEYCLSAIPLGGYVRFLDDREGDVDPADEGRAFNHRPVWARILVLLAGPFFNFIFAIFAYWLLFVGGIPTLQPAVGKITPDSHAAAAGLTYGDKIVKVGERGTADWETALTAIFDGVASDGKVALTVESASGQQRVAVIDVGDEARRLTEPNMLFDGLGFRPWQATATNEIAALTEDGAAILAGLQVGDRITAINEKPIANFEDLYTMIVAMPGEEASIRVERGGSVRFFDLQVGSVESDGQTIGLLGVRPVPEESGNYYTRKFGLVESIPKATERMLSTTLFTLRMLGRMVTGDVSIKNISGPINIAQFAGDSAERGFSEFLGFLALVSISLGVLNLMPLPILDGGQIVYQTVEWLKGSPLSERSQIIGQQFGIIALILLMSFAFYNDIARILS